MAQKRCLTLTGLQSDPITCNIPPMSAWHIRGIRLWELLVGNWINDKNQEIEEHLQLWLSWVRNCLGKRRWDDFKAKCFYSFSCIIALVKDALLFFKCRETRQWFSPIFCRKIFEMATGAISLIFSVLRLFELYLEVDWYRRKAPSGSSYHPALAKYTCGKCWQVYLLFEKVWFTTQWNLSPL